MHTENDTVHNSEYAPTSLMAIAEVRPSLDSDTRLTKNSLSYLDLEILQPAAYNGRWRPNHLRT